MLGYKAKLILKKNRSLSSIQDVIVIGGGPGGYVAAIKASQLGLKSMCIEGRGSLGGTCLNVGCIPSKSLLHNSHLYHATKFDYKKRGIKVSEVHLDLSKMMRMKEKSVKSLTNGIEHLFRKNKTSYRKGWGEITGSNEVTLTKINGVKEIIKTKNIIIATGSEVVPLPGIKIDEVDILSSTGALTLKEVPKKLLVIGAGVIGLELGSVWQRLGSSVEIVELMNSILPGMDGEIVKLSQKLFKHQGIKFTLNCSVKNVIKRTKEEILVELQDIDKKNSVRIVNKVLISIGRRPYLKGLGLEKQGIKMNGSKIEVNEYWQSTSHSNIYAIGDVIKGEMLAHKAEEEGIAVIETILGRTGHVNYDVIPGVVYTNPEIASVGKTEEILKAKNIRFNKGIFPLFANSRARTTDETEGIVKILSDSMTDQILGCHIIGTNAGEMISEGVIAIKYGASSEDLARTCHAHPTLSEAFKEACMEAYDKAIHI